jgi:hypothetical protein
VLEPRYSTLLLKLDEFKLEALSNSVEATAEFKLEASSFKT